MVLRSTGEVPLLRVKEVIILRMHPQTLIIGQTHAMGGLFPGGSLAVSQSGDANQLPERIGSGALKMMDGARGITQILARHQVGEIVVITSTVYSSGPVTPLMQKRPSSRFEKTHTKGEPSRLGSRRRTAKGTPRRR